MKAISHLPAGYRQIDSIDLQKDKKAALTVNALALLIGAAMILGANLFVPITSLFTGSDSLTVGLRFLVLGVSIFAYLFLHELVHGIVMKALGTKKVRYGFTGLYAFAGSDDYYDKSGLPDRCLGPNSDLWRSVCRHPPACSAGVVLGRLSFAGHQPFRRRRRPVCDRPVCPAAKGHRRQGLRGQHDGLLEKRMLNENPRREGKSFPSFLF